MTNDSRSHTLYLIHRSIFTNAGPRLSSRHFRIAATLTLSMRAASDSRTTKILGSILVPASAFALSLRSALSFRFFHYSFEGLPTLGGNLPSSFGGQFLGAGNATTTLQFPGG